ncbi:MAG: hypothetical protein H3C43_07105 [Leptonema sp. (in: Bacteria)]|nr:hypothetical protein [Leptonema sp. (in: bacteria)]
MQIKRNSVWVAMIGFVYLAIGCQDKQMSDLYKSTLQKNESGAIIAKSGKYELRQNQSSFARENFSVINGKEVVEKSQENITRHNKIIFALRRLLIKT